jgi:pimeloyl-ACP methyl ester carboxylesterase
MTSYTPPIELFDSSSSQAGVARPDEAIVFVHGIFSSHRTFTKAHKFFRRVSRNKNFELAFFDYDYTRALIDNGSALAKALLLRYGHGETKVTLICHSMGGLIARLAIIANDSRLPFLKTIFMLGTPNRGAFHTRQLDPLMASVVESGLPAKAVPRRARGILELTEAYSILESYRTGSDKADHILYVTIPGCFFHDRRAVSKRRDVPEKKFWAIDFLASLSEGLPFISVRLSRPHDGVVERNSNSLIPCDTAQWSEKAKSINFKANPSPTYIHVQHRICDELTHGRIQSSLKLLRIVWEIMQAGSIASWTSRLTEKDFDNLFYWTTNPM